MSEHVNGGVGVQMVARTRVVAQGGSVQNGAGRIQVKKRRQRADFPLRLDRLLGRQPVAADAATVGFSESETFEALQKSHLADYQRYFKRVDLDLGAAGNVDLPTESRLVALQKAHSIRICSKRITSSVAIY